MTNEYLSPKINIWDCYLKWMNSFLWVTLLRRESQLLMTQCWCIHWIAMKDHVKREPFHSNCFETCLKCIRWKWCSFERLKANPCISENHLLKIYEQNLCAPSKRLICCLLFDWVCGCHSCSYIKVEIWWKGQKRRRGPRMQMADDDVVFFKISIHLTCIPSGVKEGWGNDF